ncbi:MAG: electron transfer flavoprotein beta subunit/FixA family protein [Syntrophomonadaceae bacterium]|nr:electron transfer flavoprotein beta subunit/FixA family protein [Syntrophomonadaceae bacterium]
MKRKDTAKCRNVWCEIDSVFCKGDVNVSKVVACYKWVADEADLRIDADLSVDFSRVKGKISDYDKNAIAEAVNIATAWGEKAVGLTFGTAKAKQSVKDALSRGLEEGYWINADEAADADGAAVAKALAAVIQRIDDVGLVVCAEGASDTFARQVPSRIGAVLDWPVVTSVMKIEIAGNGLMTVRRLDDCMQTVKVQLPAVIAVLPEINTPPIPGLKAVMAAAKKPVHEFKGGDLGINFTPKTKAVEFKGYVMARKNVIFKEGEAADKVRELAAALRKEGVL